MEDITDADTRTQKRFYRDFEIKKLIEYHVFHIQNDRFLLTDVFNNFRNMRVEIYGLDCAYFLSTSRLARQAALRNTKVKLHLLTHTRKRY